MYTKYMDLSHVMEILENMSDEARAAELLKELNDSTKELGTLIMNQDNKLSHDEWKSKCDAAKEKVDSIIKKIESLS